MTRLPCHRASAVPRLAATALTGVLALAPVLLASPAQAAATVRARTVAGAPPRPAVVAPPQAAVVAPPRTALVAPPRTVPARPAGLAPPDAVPLAGDPVRDDQWQLGTLDVTEAWAEATGQGVTVAVIDSGVDGNHPDLTGQVLAGTDLVAGRGDGRTDPVGHGTTVAGIIAGRSDDNRGVVGIAPAAKILPIRVLDRENRYDDALIVAKAVRWAVDAGAQVVNLSLGGNGNSAALAAALDYAFAKDVVVVACTGNLSPTGSAEVWYPAREPGVLAVTGLERDGRTLWSGAITGQQTVVAAPATGLMGARPGGYWKVQGTSFAAPMVAATAALVRSRWPEMSAANVINRVLRTARDVGPLGRDDKYGFGMVDPAAALVADVPQVARNPLDNAPPPGVAGFGPAPGVGETPASPATTTPNPVGARAPGANAGWAAQPAATPPPGDTGLGWLASTAIAALLTVLVLAVLRRHGRIP